MRRRGFLQAIAAVAGALVVAPLVTLERLATKVPPFRTGGVVNGPMRKWVTKDDDLCGGFIIPREVADDLIDGFRRKSLLLNHCNPPSVINCRCVTKWRESK